MIKQLMEAYLTSQPVAAQLLSLVRASLWSRAADTRPFASGGDTDWDAIGRLAMLQTVGPLVAEGAATLPPALMPPGEWLRKGIALVECNRRTHRLVDSCVARAFAILEQAGISPVLLKGQAYARVYPDPSLRQCGDIDIYVGPEAYRHAYEAASGPEWHHHLKFSPDDKHYSCSFRGVKTELHRSAALLSSATPDRRFRQWSDRLLSRCSRTMSIGGREVAVPPEMFDVVYVFIHMFHHFIYGGVGLRQVCDWVMLLHAHAGQIDPQELERMLRGLRLLKAWQLFTPVAVNALGLPPGECPLFAPQCSRKGAIALSFIIREGNFGHGVKRKTGRPAGYLMRKASSALSFTGRLYSKFSVAPSTILRLHASFILRGLRQVGADIMRRRR